MKNWNEIQEALSLKGQFVMAIWSMAMLYLVLAFHKVDSSVITLYGLILGAFTTHQITTKVTGVNGASGQ